MDRVLASVVPDVICFLTSVIIERCRLESLWETADGEYFFEALDLF